MTSLIPRLLLLAAGLHLAACGNAAAPSGGGACGPLKVTVDGQELTGLGHGLALTQSTGSSTSEQVQLFNHDKVTCEEVLSRAGRTVAQGEIRVRANAGTETLMRSVGIDVHTQLGVAVRLVGGKPAKPGDQVTLCVPETSFTPAMGDFEKKQVTISGTFTGTYCGAMAPF